MKGIRAGVHGMALLIVDLAGIGLGAVAAYKVTGTPNQIWLQLPLALVLSPFFFWAWLFLLRLASGRKLLLAGPNEALLALTASLMWAPLIFVPLHYFTQGYLTSLGNLIGLALYQLPVNCLTLFALPLLHLSPSSDALSARR